MVMQVSHIYSDWRRLCRGMDYKTANCWSKQQLLIDQRPSLNQICVWRICPECPEPQEYTIDVNRRADNNNRSNHHLLEVREAFS